MNFIYWLWMLVIACGQLVPATTTNVPLDAPLPYHLDFNTSTGNVDVVSSMGKIVNSYDPVRLTADLSLRLPFLQDDESFIIYRSGPNWEMVVDTEYEPSQWLFIGPDACTGFSVINRVGASGCYALKYDGVIDLVYHQESIQRFDWRYPEKTLMLSSDSVSYVWTDFTADRLIRIFPKNLRSMSDIQTESTREGLLVHGFVDGTSYTLIIGTSDCNGIYVMAGGPDALGCWQLGHYWSYTHIVER